MLLNIMDYLKKAELLKTPYKGVVVDNVDSLKLGRVKVQINELLEHEASNLPWVYPWNPIGLGGASDSSWFGVPEIGSEIIIEFPFNDIYFGFYTGYWQSNNTHQTVFDTDYPETYGFRDSTGNIFKVNKSTGDVEFTHSSGTIISLDVDGKVLINSLNDVQVNATTVDVNATNVDVDSSNIDLGDGVLQKLLNETAMAAYNSHIHGVIGGVTTVTPSQMAINVHTTEDTTAS